MNSRQFREMFWRQIKLFLNIFFRKYKKEVLQVMTTARKSSLIEQHFLFRASNYNLWDHIMHTFF